MARVEEIHIKGRFDSKEIERGINALEQFAKIADITTESFKALAKQYAQESKQLNQQRANLKKVSEQLKVQIKRIDDLEKKQKKLTGTQEKFGNRLKHDTTVTLPKARKNFEDTIKSLDKYNAGLKKSAQNSDIAKGGVQKLSKEMILNNRIVSQRNALIDKAVVATRLAGDKEVIYAKFMEKTAQAQEKVNFHTKIAKKDRNELISLTAKASVQEKQFSDAVKALTKIEEQANLTKEQKAKLQEKVMKGGQNALKVLNQLNQAEKEAER